MCNISIDLINAEIESRRGRLGDAYASMLQSILNEFENRTPNFEVFVTNGFAPETLQELNSTRNLSDDVLAESAKILNDIITDIVRLNNEGR